jgi:hypothetical protein
MADQVQTSAAQNNTQAAAVDTSNKVSDQTSVDSGTLIGGEGAANAESKGTVQPPTQTSTEKVDDSKGKVPGESKPDVAPEKYEAFKVPEGQALDPKMVEKFTGIAKELNLSQDKAQKLIDLSVEQAKQIVDSQESQMKVVRETWRNEIKNDADFGGTKFNDTITQASRVVNKYGSPEFKKFLVLTGYGDNPEVIKTFAKIGKVLSEDRAVDGKAGSGSEKSAAQVIYGTK